MNEEKGITLIALIITIILLIILAMVSVGILNNSRITEHAQYAAEEHKLAEEKEKIQLGYSNYKINKYAPVERTEDQEKLESFFLNKNLMSLIDMENSTEAGYVINYNNEQIILDEMGQGTDTNEIWLYFSYNGHRYKIIAENNENAVVKKLEIVKQNQLTVDGAEIDGDESKGWIIVFSDTKNRYKLSSTGEIEETVSISEGSLVQAYVNGELKLADKVAYTPEAGKSITVGKEESNSSKDLTVSTDNTYNLEWQVMDVNDVTGIVTLIASKPIKPQKFYSSDDYIIKGNAGYYNGPEVLNKLCSVFGTGKGATGARSLTVEDVNKVLGFDETKYENPNNGNENYDPVRNEKYGYQMTFYAEKTTWNPQDTYKFKDGRTEYVRPNNVSVGDQKTFIDIDGNTATDEKPITITTNHYVYDDYDIDANRNLEIMMLGNHDENDTLLASRGIMSQLGNTSVTAIWGLYSVYLGNVRIAPVYYATGSQHEHGNTTVQSIRPVVTLEANILGEKDENGVWQLK